MKTTIKIGDTVNWRGSWGSDPARPAKVTAMEVTARPREKYGSEVDEVSVDLVRQNRVVFTLDNGHWAYSDQIAGLAISESPATNGTITTQGDHE